MPPDLSMARRRRDRTQFGTGGVEGQASQRQLRVGEEVRHGLSKILREGGCRDPVVENASITVTEVRMSADLRNATAFVTPLAGTNATEVVAALKRNALFLKGMVAREVQLRNAPNLVFALDDSFDRAVRISRLLARPEVARDLQPQSAGGGNRDNEG
jgi:ribosome-binding factor A